MSGPLTDGAARVLLGPVLMVGAAILIKGYAAVGDGFSAGLVIALGLLLQYVAFGREHVEKRLPLSHLPRFALGSLLVVLLLVFVPVAAGLPPLTHQPAAAQAPKFGTLELTTALAFDAALCVLVVGSVIGIVHAVGQSREEGER